MVNLMEEVDYLVYLVSLILHKVGVTHHFVNGPIEAIIFCKNQQYYKCHVHVVWISFFNMIEDLKNGQNLNKMGILLK